MNEVTRMTWGHTYWPWWLIITSTTFLVPELYAVFTNTLNTLSAYSWLELGWSLKVPRIPETAAWFITQGAYLVAVAWLWRHIWYHQFT